MAAILADDNFKSIFLNENYSILRGGGGGGGGVWVIYILTGYLGLASQ